MVSRWEYPLVLFSATLFMLAVSFGNSPAPAQTTNHAAVIVSTGSSTRATCVTFDSETISGRQALDLAGVNAVYASFGGVGSAVCSLLGTGCAGDSSCLTCQQPNFWNYSRAVAGATSFSASPVGASLSVVRDGDVEGWRWGTSGSPAYQSVANVCQLETEETTTTALPKIGGPLKVPTSVGVGDDGARAERSTTTRKATVASSTTSTQIVQVLGERTERPRTKPKIKPAPKPEPDSNGWPWPFVGMGFLAAGAGFWVWKRRTGAA